MYNITTAVPKHYSLIYSSTYSGGVVEDVAFVVSQDEDVSEAAVQRGGERWQQVVEQSHGLHSWGHYCARGGRGHDSDEGERGGAVQCQTLVEVA
jgi:hypothetical protein